MSLCPLSFFGAYQYGLWRGIGTGSRWVQLRRDMIRRYRNCYLCVFRWLDASFWRESWRWYWVGVFKLEAIVIAIDSMGSGLWREGVAGLGAGLIGLIGGNWSLFGWMCRAALVLFVRATVLVSNLSEARNFFFRVFEERRLFKLTFPSW